MAQRKPPLVDHDLRWLLCESEAAASGLGSSHRILVDLALSGGARSSHAGSSKTPPARRIEDTGRHRSLRARYLSVPQPHRDVLLVAYGPPVCRLSPPEARRLGQWPFVSLMTRSASSAFDREVGRRDGAAAARLQRRGVGEWLRGPSLDARLLGRVREEASALMAAAWAEWVATVPAESRRGRRDAPRFRPAIAACRPFSVPGGL